MKPTEAEILEVTKFKPRKKYKNRNEYVIALVRAVDSLSADKFEYLLSNQVYNWYVEAAKAFLADKVLPDLPDATMGELRYRRGGEDYLAPKLPVVTPEEHRNNVQTFQKA